MGKWQRLKALMYERIKRVGDVAVSGAALIVLSPVILGTFLMVRAQLGSPVIFRQERPGLHGEVFEMLKFRTMLLPDPVRGRVTDEERMTRLGGFLRSTSLDELPGLVNVLRGEVSLVGPRPLHTRYLGRYSSEQTRRHEVRPGLTGLAQISGRNALSWDDRFDLDLHYVRTRGLRTDLFILLATLPAVLRREGVTEAGHATMSEFFGPRRIGNHELRSSAGVDGGEIWEIVERSTGVIAGRGKLMPDPDGFELSLDLVPGLPDPEAVRTRGVEMLRGVARERGSSIRITPSSRVDAERLGVSSVRAAADPVSTTPV